MSVRAGIVGARLDSVVAKEFAADVQYYLTQTPRQLPSRYLYDGLGSALFEAICRLPWYGITRAEGRLLRTHGRVFDACHRLGIARAACQERETSLAQRPDQIHFSRRFENRFAQAQVALRQGEEPVFNVLKKLDQ